jgi:hypothetical protein
VGDTAITGSALHGVIPCASGRRAAPFPPDSAERSSPSLAPRLQTRPRLAVSGCLAGGRGAGGGVEMITLWVKTPRRLLDRRSPSVGRSRLVRRREPGASVPGAASAPGTPLPDGPAPSSWVSVPNSPDFQPRLASPDVGFYSLFTKLRCEGGTTRGASRGDVLSPSLARRPVRRRLAAEPQRPAPTRPKAMVARPCRNELRNHGGDPSSGPPWPLACARRAEPGHGSDAATQGHLLPLKKPRLRVPRWRAATARRPPGASPVLDDFFQTDERSRCRPSNEGRT